MLKVRVTFVDNEKGREELNAALSKLEKDFNIISQSNIYRGRGKSQYSNVYVDLENK